MMAIRDIVESGLGLVRRGCIFHSLQIKNLGLLNLDKG